MVRCFLSKGIMKINLIWLALIFTLFSTFPQLLQIIQTKETRDFNLESQCLALVSNVLIAIESFLGGDIAALILSVWLCIYRLVIIYYKLYPPGGIVIRNQEEGEF